MRRVFVLILLMNSSVFSQSYSDFELKVREDSLGSYLIGKNLLPTSITLKLIDEKNDQILRKFIIQSLDSVELLRDEKRNKKDFLEFYKKNYRANYSFGDSLSSQPDKDFLYSLPFKKNRKYKVIQSWFGKFSHNHPASFHAVDFKMNISQPIHAARGGVVVRTVEKYKKNGGRELINNANTIVMRHDDGTFASYVHLKYQGSEVKVGQKVRQGDLIGYSGNTGFSTQPHLHFVVRDGTTKSIPIYFKRYEKQKLKRGKKYKAQ